MTDPLIAHDARQTAQDAAGDVAASIQDAIDVQTLFDAARVRYVAITPQSDGSVRVASDIDFSTSALARLYRAMNTEDNWNGGTFTVSWQMDGRGGSAWVLVRRT